MKKIFLLVFTSALMLVSSCQKPEFIEPTADRQGLTSLSAIFTFGPFQDQEIVRMPISDDTQTKYVIPIPFYYPETSSDETAPYMTKMRVQAMLEPNCIITPGLGDQLLDLTKENWFVYTNAKGESRDICITGERIKSDKCELIAFSLVEPAMSGIIDKATNSVTLISVEDLSACTAKVELSAHATISPDPAEPRSYNEPVTFTVTAHNGKTTAEYVVSKGNPDKIEAGFNLETVEQLFHMEPVSMIGLPPYNTLMNPSLAYVDGKLVINTGVDAPIYLNGVTGVKEGTINVGSAEVAAIASDEGGNLIICNHVETAGETINIWRTRSVTEAPELFYSYENPIALPTGYKMKVNGNIDTDAVIIMTNEGVDGITSSSTVNAIIIKDGVPVETRNIDMSGTGLAWGSAPVNASVIVAATSNIDDGLMGCKYEYPLVWMKGDGSCGASLTGGNWAINPNFMDAKSFNNKNYAALFVVSHFPHWGSGPQLYLYDITDRTALGDNYESSSAAVLSNPAMEWYQKGDTGYATGDVIITPSPDGFKVMVYYYDCNSHVLGGYSADCIKR